MNPYKIIKKYYKEGSKLYKILTTHGEVVAQRALEIAALNPHLKIDMKFVEEAAILHDIGIFYTDSPKIFCTGDKPYICHGYLGRELLEKEGYPKHALVCERHIGTGITKNEIINNELPVPLRDMSPQTNEEILICFADKFYSKSKHLTIAKPMKKIKKSISKYGPDKIKVFNTWAEMFNVPVHIDF